MTDPELRERFDDLFAELRAMRSLIEESRASTVTPDGPHARLVVALAETLTDLDLSFDASEVLDAARLDCTLDAALRALSLTTPAAVGAWLRARRDRSLAGFVVRRDGRAWRLDRCT